MIGLIKNGKPLDIDFSFEVMNFTEVTRKMPILRGSIPDYSNIVIHENAGASFAENVSKNFRKYGYHIGIDFGTFDQAIVYQFCDLGDKIYHGSQLNKTGLGIVILGPYYPRIKSNASKREMIPAQWWTHCSPKNDRRYVCPTDSQLKVTEELLRKLCPVLGIPYEFPTANLGPRQRKIKRWWLRAKPGPGVVAHGDYSGHADGRYILERLIENQNETPVVKTCGECGRVL